MECMRYLEENITIRNEIYEEKFKKWESLFKNIYGELNSELFLRHSYFALILKVILIIKLCLIQNLDFEDAYEDCKEISLDELDLFEYDYFDWINPNRIIFRKIYDI